MKEIAQLLLKLNISTTAYSIVKESGKIFPARIDSENALDIFDRTEIIGLAINTGPPDLRAIRFTKPNAPLIEELFTNIGLNKGYSWAIKREDDLTIILRIRNAPYILSLNSKFKKDFAESMRTNSQHELSHIVIVDQFGNQLLTPSLDEPPYSIEYGQFLHAISEFVDVDKLIEEEEEKQTKKLSKEVSDHVETPLLPYRIFDKLPESIKKYSKQFSLVREKDISLLSLLVVLSSVLPNIVSRHRNKKIWAHLYLVVTAPPASGKGVIADSISVVRKIEKEFRDTFDQQLREYNIEYSRYKKGEIDEEPTAPVLKTIQLPTDTSFIALFEQLVANDGSGLMLETEIDSFVNAGKQEWGNYSVLNRKATHHEPHLLDRKGFKKPLYLASPKIAMVLGGTNGQFFSLFRSTEDGLFSRFLIYCYQLKQIVLQNPFTNDMGDFFDTVTEEFANEVQALYTQLSRLESEIEFQWTAKQSNKLYKHFEKLLLSVGDLYGENSNSVILRHMLAATRLGMVLSTISAYEKGTLFSSRHLSASDDITDTVIDIVTTCSQHSLLMMANIDANSKNKPVEMKSHNMLRFLNALPEGRSFKTKDAIKIGLSIRVSERSVGDYLASLSKSKHLEQTGYGEYRRLK
ncbi:MAG: DUF3987 domain-containing protein [Cyclobacteriaceae bacterium]|nr:DUF3987 domain-containing protein [Cyclobacteriaceae bacterium]